jgi:hypothetical protein
MSVASPDPLAIKSVVESGDRGSHPAPPLSESGLSPCSTSETASESCRCQAQKQTLPCPSHARCRSHQEHPGLLGKSASHKKKSRIRSQRTPEFPQSRNFIMGAQHTDCAPCWQSGWRALDRKDPRGVRWNTALGVRGLKGGERPL